MPAEPMLLDPDGTATVTNLVGNGMEVEFDLEFDLDLDLVGPRSTVPNRVPLLS